MKEITFTIDEATGMLTVTIRGIKGPGCVQYQKIVEDYLGKPEGQQETPEYTAKVQRTIQSKRS